jgi:putative tryptophan/tyrosine transport system substrate-binding protein
MPYARSHGRVVSVSAPPALSLSVSVDLAAHTQLPAIHYVRSFVETDGLMSYQGNEAERFRRLAIYVDKLLKDANPADLPVEQPTTFELIVDLKTAQALGLTIPPTPLQADEVIR